MRLLTSLSFQLLFVSFFLAIITNAERYMDGLCGIDDDTDGTTVYGHGQDRTLPPYTRALTYTAPERKGVWHDLWCTGKTVTKEVDNRTAIATENVTQAIDGEAGNKLPNLPGKSLASPPYPPALTSTAPKRKGFWHDLWDGGKATAVDRRAAIATENVTQAIDGEADNKLPNLPGKSLALSPYTLALTSAALKVKGTAKQLDKRGTTVTAYVTRTVFSNPTVTVIKTKTPGTTVRMTNTIYRTKVKTRTISVNGMARTTSESEAVLESGGWMLNSARCSGSALAGLALAVVMFVYA